MSPPRTVAEPSPLRSRTVTPKSVKSETPEPVYPSPIVDPKWEQVVTFSHQGMFPQSPLGAIRNSPC
ncbi:hypothetical protein M427DRAFT_61531 [Gonapodya prolifera JEL478]|uniref:Uncharacterized protein n=1 Tax=Gonapodya prolifera (strain JEL478) TaxID=1344416 RepID=A0A139A214_GONPJ|nr:hypothetical protein M427DRAFT_61531 [Gonapodya prolifera JEL478]|eukprot:KXS10817.1 hypothetical protein M427DRAFT_61531 [Gonapodya prolifera JEL478]